MTAHALTEQPAPLPPLAAASEPPFVVCCVPIRSRAWAVPLLHAALAGQQRPPEALLFVEGDSEDDTAAAIGRLPRNGVPEVEMVTGHTGSPFWSRDREGEKYTGDQHQHLAYIYNLCLEQGLCAAGAEATHFWMLDSDVIPDPDVLRLLLAADKDVCAAVVRNSPGALNFMLGFDNGEPRRTGHEGLYLERTEQNPFMEPFTVPFVSACVLYRREVLEAGCRFAPHPRSHDFGIVSALSAAGYSMWVEPRARCSHYFHGPKEDPLRP